MCRFFRMIDSEYMQALCSLTYVRGIRFQILFYFAYSFVLPHPEENPFRNTLSDGDYIIVNGSIRRQRYIMHIRVYSLRFVSDNLCMHFISFWCLLHEHV